MKLLVSIAAVITVLMLAPLGGSQTNPQGTVHVLASFDTFTPAALIVGKDGNLYGAGIQCCGKSGVIFKINPSSGHITVLHQFDGGDGWKPLALLQGIDGNFYGVTEQGAGAGCTNGCGEVFEMDSASPHSVHVIYEFSGGSLPYQPYYLVQGSDGMLYGLTYEGNNGSFGGIFSLNTSGGNFSVLHTFNLNDGVQPTVLLPPYAGVLYGASPNGGPKGNGEIFSINSDGSNFNIVYAFTGGRTDGGTPVALAQTSSGVLYGVAQARTGELFQVNLSGSVDVLQTFASDGSQGSSPNSLACVQIGTGFVLLGTTIGGGFNNTGVVFEYVLENSTFSNVYPFSGGLRDPGLSGSLPSAGIPLVQASNEAIYGAVGGGTYGNAAAYQFSLSGFSGIRNVITAGSLTPVNSMACPSGTAGYNCFSIQQNFYVPTLSNPDVPAYWVQNLFEVLQNSPGAWQVAHAYQIWQVDPSSGAKGSLIECNGISFPVINQCYENLTWTTWSSTSNLSGSPSLTLQTTISEKGATSFAASIGKTALRPFPPAKLPAGSLVMAMTTNQEVDVEDQLYYWEPELMLVGYNDSAEVNFCSASSDCSSLGTVEAQFQLAQPKSWQSVGTQYADANAHTVCSSTRETSTGLWWYVPNAGAATFTTTSESGYTEDYGIIFVPALGATALAGCQ